MKKVLITGGSVGIGRQAALDFAAQGACVTINYRSAEEDAAQTLSLIEKAGGKGFMLKADLSDSAQAEAMVRAAALLMGGLDVLVNNAGVTRFIPFPDLDAVTAEDWSFLYQTNVESIFFCSRAANKIMQEQEDGGCIINLASVSGMLPRGSSIPYAVSKSAIIHLTKCLSQVMAPKVRVNSVSPGVVTQTRWNAENPAFDPAAQQSGAANVPLKRLAVPEDIAAAILFLASDAASYITGVNLPVEGGMNIK